MAVSYFVSLRAGGSSFIVGQGTLNSKLSQDWWRMEVNSAVAALDTREMDANARAIHLKARLDAVKVTVQPEPFSSLQDAPQGGRYYHTATVRTAYHHTVMYAQHTTIRSWYAQHTTLRSWYA